MCRAKEASATPLAHITGTLAKSDVGQKIGGLLVENALDLMDYLFYLCSLLIFYCGEGSPDLAWDECGSATDQGRR